MSSHKNVHFCLVQCILQSLALIRALVLSLVGALANARAPTRLSTRARIQCKDCKMHDTQHAVRVFIVSQVSANAERYNISAPWSVVTTTDQVEVRCSMPPL